MSKNFGEDESDFYVSCMYVYFSISIFRFHLGSYTYHYMLCICIAVTIHSLLPFSFMFRINNPSNKRVCLTFSFQLTHVVDKLTNNIECLNIQN